MILEQTLHVLLQYSDELKFSADVAEGIQGSREKVAGDLFNVLAHVHEYQYQYYSAMIFTDALSGYTDEMIELLTEKTMGKYQFFSTLHEIMDRLKKIDGSRIIR